MACIRKDSDAITKSTTLMIPPSYVAICTGIKAFIYQ